MTAAALALAVALLAALGPSPAGAATAEPRLEAAVRALIAARFPDGSAEIVSMRSVADPGEIPPAASIEAQEPVNGLAAGTSLLSIRIQDRPEAAVRIVPMAVTLRLYGPVVVAARDLLRGELVDAAALKIERRVLKRGDRVLNDPQPALGLAAKGTIRKGDVVRLGALTRPAAVEPGQTVVLQIEQGGVALAMETTARGRGEVGQVVLVEGMDRKPIRARIVAPGRVEVWKAARTAPGDQPARAAQAAETKEAS